MGVLSVIWLAFGNPDWHIREFEKFSIDMMGYAIHRNGKVTIRDRDFIKVRRMLLRGQGSMTYGQAQRINSQKGFIKYSDSTKIQHDYSTANTYKKASKIISDHDKSQT